MFLKNKKTNASGDMTTQFESFKKQILSSGKKPEQILNDLISSGRVNSQQLENAKRLANLYSYLIKK